eukprot:29090-Pelagococcus_subviridis.AAC.4
MNPRRGENPPVARSSTSHALRCESSSERVADATIAAAFAASETMRFTRDPPCGAMRDPAPEAARDDAKNPR